MSPSSAHAPLGRRRSKIISSPKTSNAFELSAIWRFTFNGREMGLDSRYTQDLSSDSSSDRASTVDPYSEQVVSKHLSFLSMGPNPQTPSVTNFDGKPRCFSSASSLLDYVTRNWRLSFQWCYRQCIDLQTHRLDFVTVDLYTRDVVEAFVKRPFFLLLSIDAPLLARFYRTNTNMR